MAIEPGKGGWVIVVAAKGTIVVAAEKKTLNSLITRLIFGEIVLSCIGS